MRRSLLIVLTALLAGVLGAGVAVAATGGGRSPESTSVNEGVAPILVNAQARDARLVVHIDGNAGLNTFNIARAKGVTAVTNPAEGLYCIRPNVPGLQPARIVPAVSVDWSTSPTNAVMAQWKSNRGACPVGNIAIVTINGEDGTWDEDNNVGFTVVVP